MYVTRVNVFQALQGMQNGHCTVKWGFLIWRTGPQSWVVGLNGSVSFRDTGATLDDATDKIWDELRKCST